MAAPPPPITLYRSLTPASMPCVIGGRELSRRRRPNPCWSMNWRALQSGATLAEKMSEWGYGLLAGAQWHWAVELVAGGSSADVPMNLSCIVYAGFPLVVFYCSLHCRTSAPTKSSLAFMP